MDPLDHRFRISDVDGAADPKYYGFLAANGNWYIQREVASPNQFRYVYGWSDYATAWANRASLSYDLFDVVFGLC